MNANGREFAEIYWRQFACIRGGNRQAGTAKATAAGVGASLASIMRMKASRYFIPHVSPSGSDLISAFLTSDYRLPISAFRLS